MKRNYSLKNRGFVLSCILVVSLVVSFSSNIPLAVAYPYIFEDDFETGDFSKWTAGGGNPSVTSGDAHCGTYKAVLNESGEYEQAWFTSVDHCFMRAYVMFKSFPAAGYETTILGVCNTSGYYMAEARVGNFAGTLKWRFRYYNNGVSVTVTSEQKKPVLDTWYCVEVEGKSNSATDAEARIYVDENELTDVSQTGLNNTRKINCAYIWESVSDGNVIQWYDCVAVNTGYIGQECALTVNTVGGGSVAKSPDRNSYNWGTNVTLTATATTGWSFDHWSGDASGTINPITINMTSDKDVTATFIQIGAPVIDSFYPSSDPIVAEGQSQQFNVTCHDPDGDPLYYAWLLDDFMQSASQNWTYTPDYFSAGVHNVTLLISDSYGLHITQQWSVTVLDVNVSQAPIISYYSPADTTPEVDEGSSLVFEHVSSDPDLDPLWYAWLMDNFMYADTQNWTYTPDYFSAGVHNVTLLISDSYGLHATRQWDVTVANVNRAPTIDYYAPVETSPEVDEGDSLVFEHVSSDQDGDPLYYAWLLDDFMQSASQNWTYTPDYYVAGVHNITLLISDSYGSIATQQWSVTVANVNRAPTIDSYTPLDLEPQVDEGASLDFTHTSSDLDGDPLYYAWLVDGFMYADTQNWTYTPDYNAAGVHNITLLISDSYGSIATQQWSVTVVDV